MRWYFRFIMGQGLLGSGVSMLMLSIAAAPVIAKFLQCRTLWIAMGLPAVIVGIFVVTGYMMDINHWEQHLDDQRRSRSNTWDKCFKQLDRIEYGH